jgi:hypothetical protein
VPQPFKATGRTIVCMISFLDFYAEQGMVKDFEQNGRKH